MLATEFDDRFRVAPKSVDVTAEQIRAYRREYARKPGSERDRSPAHRRAPAPSAHVLLHSPSRPIRMGKITHHGDARCPGRNATLRLDPVWIDRCSAPPDYMSRSPRHRPGKGTSGRRCGRQPTSRSLRTRLPASRSIFFGVLARRARSPRPQQGRSHSRNRCKPLAVPRAGSEFLSTGERGCGFRRG